jgi:hypothetical protein
VTITTDDVSSNTTQDKVYNNDIMWKSLSATCSRSVLLSGYFTNNTDSHDMTEILFKVALNTTKPTNMFRVKCSPQFLHIFLIFYLQCFHGDWQTTLVILQWHHCHQWIFKFSLSYFWNMKETKTIEVFV